MLINYGRKSPAFRRVQLGRVAVYDIEAYLESGGCLKTNFPSYFPFATFSVLSLTAPPPLQPFPQLLTFYMPQAFSVRG